MGRVLSSWKDIAGFLGKGVRTVQRWEKELHLPVRRPAGGVRHVVFADSDELASWATRRLARHQGVKSVLLFEPDRETRHLLRACLEDDGFFVFCCSNEREAWFVFEEGPPVELLVCGVQRADAGGTDLPGLFAKRRSKLPMILIPRTAPADGASDEIANKGWIVLSRPLQPAIFLRAVEQALAHKIGDTQFAAQAHNDVPAASSQSNAL